MNSTGNAIMAISNYTDLAPGILRQRLVVEGYPSKPITDGAIKDYLSKLSEVIQMKTLLNPVTHRSDRYGWAGWIHWETSGAHFYAWERPLLFFSVDLYTCKEFDPKMVLDFTRKFFQATEIAARDFSSAPPTNSAAELAIAPIIKYTLSEPELEALTKRLLSEQPPRSQDALVEYRLDGTNELSNLGRHVERQVFEERFGNNDADMRRLYGDYESPSTFFLVVDQRIFRPVGTMRTIRNSPAGFGTLRDAHKYAGISVERFKEHYGIKDLDRVWDMGTLAIPKQYRDRDEHHIAVLLHRGTHLRGHYEGITHYIALIDADLNRTFRWTGFPFYPLAGSRSFSFEGSSETTVMCGITLDFFPEVEKSLRNADEKSKPALSYFARRFVHGFDIDQRLNFEYSIWPGGSTPLKQSPGEKARL